MFIYKMYGKAEVGDYADLICDKAGAARVCATVDGAARQYEFAGDGWWDVTFPASPSVTEIREALATLNNVPLEDILVVRGV